MDEDRAAAERWRRRTNRVADAETELVREIERTGALKHLYGKPIDAGHDPDWLAARFLKQQGFSHPTLERAKELDALREAAETPIARLQRRHAWLTTPSTRTTLDQVDQFNASRERKLEAYRQALHEVNTAIRDYNLTVLETLHRPPIRVDDVVSRVGREIPTIQQEAPSGRPARRRLFRRWPGC